MKRRDFVRKASAGITGGALLGGCGSSTSEDGAAASSWSASGDICLALSSDVLMKAPSSCNLWFHCAQTARIARNNTQIKI